ncbi:MAG: hypothetical protein KA146_13845 [Leptospiraceae bacterium]|nr:hypothetical protein [Leptospiraceae bacterium]
MNDLDRIKEIERIFGFPLHRVEKLEQLTTEKVFYTTSSLWYWSIAKRQDPFFPYKGTRNYCLDDAGNVIGLSLDYSPLYLLPTDFLKGFSQLNQLSLKEDWLPDYCFCLSSAKNGFFDTQK